MKHIIELKPADYHKSFYGKAIVYTNENGEKVLRSYDTDVCKVDTDGNFIRLWNGYSDTTMRHIRAFLLLFDCDNISKKTWMQKPIGTFY